MENFDAAMGNLEEEEEEEESEDEEDESEDEGDEKDESEEKKKKELGTVAKVGEKKRGALRDRSLDVTKFWLLLHLFRVTLYITDMSISILKDIGPPPSE